MCFSTPKNTAADEAAKAEAERMAAIRQAQGSVNAVFDSDARKADIADYVAATRAQLNDELLRQKGDSDRELKFALARGGLSGGSTEVDQRRRFGEAFARGLLDVERKAQGAGAQIESADNEARARLMGMATQGLDATTATSQAWANARNNLQAGASERSAGMLGDAFSQFKTFYDRSRDAADQRRIDRMLGGNLYGSQRPMFGG
ncbi:hypothetical protein MASR1M8_15860 [Thermomonas brevis]